MTRRITRTDRDDFGMGGLANAPGFFGTPELAGHIERQEAAGQRELVQSSQFPCDAPIAELEALGFVFGPVDEHDPLFRPATLPEDWRREGSEHAMWSHIVDEKGRKRVAIFYKAAFYDRRAAAHIVSPTERLVEAIYADDEPTGLELDDLLTEGIARDWLTRERTTTAETAALEKNLGTESARTLRRLTRVDKLLSFLPAGKSTT